MSKQRAWVFGAVLSGLVIVALGWFFGIAPKLEQAATAEAQVIDVEGQNAAQQARLDGLKAQFSKIDELRSELSDLQEQIAPVTDLSEFVDYAERLATTAGVTVVEYAADTPLPAATPLETSTAPAEPEAATTSETAPVGVTTAPVVSDAAPGGTDLYAIPVTFNLAGTDDQVFDFVAKLQQGKQIFLVSGLTFGGDDGRAVKGYLFVKKAASDSSEGSPSDSSSSAEVTVTAN